MASDARWAPERPARERRSLPAPAWFGAGLLLGLLGGGAWRAPDVIPVLFAGALVGVFLRAVTRGVMRVTRLGDGLSLTLAIIAIIIVVGGGAWFFAGRIASQFAMLSDQLPDALAHLRSSLDRTEWGRLALRAAGAAGASLTQTTKAVPLALSFTHAAADCVVAAFLGLFLAVNPALYRHGVLALLARRSRPRAARALDEMATRLERWILAQGTLMVLLGGSTALALWLVGMPLALALGVLTGAFIFVPYLGAIAAFIVTVLLALAISPRLAIEVTVIYVAVHAIEAYVLSPLLHWDIVLVPPALTLAMQTLLFVVFGFPGMLLATPMTAAAMAFIQVTYVEGLRSADATPAPRESGA